jgi:hypothetical protein
MTVFDLEARRSARAGDVPARCARCGGEWFDLRLPGGDPGAVTLRADWSVSGYAGVPYCRECDLPL